MKNLFNMVALILGIGQSQAKPQVFNHYYPTTEHFYMNGKEVSKEEFNKSFSVNKKPIELDKTQFVKMMFNTKNIICL